MSTSETGGHGSSGERQGKVVRLQLTPEQLQAVEAMFGSEVAKKLDGIEVEQLGARLHAAIIVN